MYFKGNVDFNLRVSDCEELVGVIHKRCGIRFWKVVKRNNRSGSYIFNRCSVQHYPLVASLSQPDHQVILPICH